MATVTFDHLTKAYADGTVAVNDLDLLIKDGEFLVLVGPSGCGKTTALRCLAGLEEITAGQIKSMHASSTACRRRIGTSRWSSSPMPSIRT